MEIRDGDNVYSELLAWQYDLTAAREGEKGVMDLDSWRCSETACWTSSQMASSGVVGGFRSSAVAYLM